MKMMHIIFIDIITNNMIIIGIIPPNVIIVSYLSLSLLLCIVATILNSIARKLIKIIVTTVTTFVLSLLLL